jgi:hypothetical protein
MELAELVDSAGELDSWARLSRKAAVSPSVKLKSQGWDQLFGQSLNRILSVLHR